MFLLIKSNQDLRVNYNHCERPHLVKGEPFKTKLSVERIIELMENKTQHLQNSMQTISKYDLCVHLVY